MMVLNDSGCNKEFYHTFYNFCCIEERQRVSTKIASFVKAALSSIKKAQLVGRRT